VLGFPHTCHPSYGALALTPAGFTFLLNTLAFIGHTGKVDSTVTLVRDRGVQLNNHRNAGGRNPEMGTDPLDCLADACLS